MGAGRSSLTRQDLGSLPQRHISQVVYCALDTCGELEDGMVFTHWGWITNIPAKIHTLEVTGPLTAEGLEMRLCLDLVLPFDAAQQSRLYPPCNFGDDVIVHVIRAGQRLYALEVTLNAAGAVSRCLQQYGEPKDECITPQQYVSLSKAIHSVEAKKGKSNDVFAHYLAGKTVIWLGQVVSAVPKALFVAVLSVGEQLACVELEGAPPECAVMGATLEFRAQIVNSGWQQYRPRGGRRKLTLRVQSAKVVSNHHTLEAPVAAPGTACSSRTTQLVPVA